MATLGKVISRTDRRKAGRLTEAVKDTIVRLVEQDFRTVAEVCDLVGVTPVMYYKAVGSDADFADRLATARRRAADKTVTAAKRSLLKRVTGFDCEETTNVKKLVDGEWRTVEVKTVTKHVAPDVSAIIFALTNYAPDEFKNTLTEDRAVAVGAVMTQKQADAFARKFLDLKEDE